MRRRYALHDESHVPLTPKVKLTMALTPHPELRRRLLAVLSAAGGSLPRPEALDAMDVQWGESWTPDDLMTPPTRPWELKWRNRTSFERDRLVKAGLMVHHTDGTWALTPEGWSSAQTAVNERSGAVEAERERRETLWRSLREQGGPTNVASAVVRDAGLYRGYRGVYADLANTRSDAFPNGIALTVLDLGKAYPNEMTDEGVIYHFPVTERPGRDRAEVEALRAAFQTGLVVFVLTMAPNEKRTVVRAYVEDLDTRSGLALLTFSGDSPRPVPPPPDVDFKLSDDEDDADAWAKRRARPNQARFAFAVMQRYGRRCAVCTLEVGVAIQAAHLRSKARKGRDDPRNGVPLCANHHVMFDGGLWGVDTHGRVVIHPDWDADRLALVHADLSHLPVLPHAEALGDAWTQWTKKHGES